MNTVMIIIAVLISCYLIRDAFFSIICLVNALKNRKQGLTKYNYLRWEMPNNDIENQIEDEIKINVLFLVGILIWFLTLLFYPNNIMFIYLVYAGLAFCFSKDKLNLQNRYGDYYELFSQKKSVEEFSTDLVVYGLRIEGTLTKLKKAQALSIFYVLIGCILMFL